MAWVTPVTPLEPGHGWCLADFAGGMYEFLVHPDEAEWCLANGIRIDGVDLSEIAIVDRFPEINGILIRAWNYHEEKVGFVDASQTEVRS